VLAAILSDVTSKEIFHQYFKRKLLIWGSIGIAVILIRKLSGHETSFVLAATFISSFLVAAFIIGYIDYNFYEKSAPKIIAQLIDKTPLADFQNIGFIKDEDNKLQGQINNYKVILSPIINLEGNRSLVVLIPLKIRDGLDVYFTKYNEAFRFTLTDQIIFAQAVLKNYEKEYDYKKLLSLIDKTISSLIEKDIDPLNIIDE
jgi:hypothetical protein